MAKVKKIDDLFVVFKGHMDTIAEEMKLPLISDEDARTFIAFAKEQGCADECLMDLEALRRAFDRGYPVFLERKRKGVAS